MSMNLQRQTKCVGIFRIASDTFGKCVRCEVTLPDLKESIFGFLKITQFITVFKMIFLYRKHLTSSKLSSIFKV